MRKAAFVTIAAAVAGMLLTTATPAGAIETTSFGIEPVDRDPSKGAGVPVDLRAGETTEVALRVWNKTDADLTLQLRAAAATVEESGTPRLGGDPAPAEWIRLRDTTIVLRPGERRVVTVDVAAPNRLAPTERTAAVVARPQVNGDTPPAVLQEVGLVFRMEPADGAPLVAPDSGAGAPTWLLGVAGALVAAGAGVLVHEAWRRRRVAYAVAA